MAQKVQQLATPVPLAAAKDGSSAGDTPTPGYARSSVPLHSGSDDGDMVAETVTDKDADAETEAETEADAETEAETEADTVAEAVTDGDTDDDTVTLGATDELGVTDIEKDGGAVGARKTDVLDATKARLLVMARLRVALMTKHEPPPAVPLYRSAAQVIELKLQKLQQLAGPLPGTAVRLARKLFATPTPSYLSQLVPLHTGCDVPVADGEMVLDADNDCETEGDNDADAVTDAAIDIEGVEDEVKVTAAEEVGATLGEAVTDGETDCVGVIERPFVGDTEGVAGTEANTEAVTEGDASTDGDGSGVTDTNADTDDIIDAGTDGDAVTDTDTDADRVTDTDTDADAETVAEIENDAVIEADTDSDAVPLGVMDGLDVTDIENDGGANGARKTDVFEKTKVTLERVALLMT